MAVCTLHECARCLNTCVMAMLAKGTIFDWMLCVPCVCATGGRGSDSARHVSVHVQGTSRGVMTCHPEATQEYRRECRMAGAVQVTAAAPQGGCHGGFEGLTLRELRSVDSVRPGSCLPL